jgi:hypothetical protein
MCFRSSLKQFQWPHPQLCISGCWFTPACASLHDIQILSFHNINAFNLDKERSQVMWAFQWVQNI